jgi:hypothetical protein
MDRTVKAYLDRIEEEIAVFLFENAEFYLPVSLLPEGSKPGLWFRLSLKIDDGTTAEARNRVAKLVDELNE